MTRRWRGTLSILLVAMSVALGAIYPSDAALADGTGGTATVTVNNWQVDTVTGQVSYDLAATASGSCTSGCGLSVDIGRDGAGGVVSVVGSLPVAVDGSRGADGTWSATGSAQASRVVLPESTSVRAVYSDSSGSYPGAWTTVASPYPDAAVSVASANWTADTNTGKVSFDVTVSGATLAKGGALCENAYCYPVLQGGRLAADGTTVTTVVSSLPCAGDTSFYNRYAATLHCAATDSVLPEITRVRGVITSNTGRELDSPWTTVSDPYPDAAVKVAVPQWTADPGTGKVSFDVTVSGATLAKGGALCENAYCYPVLQGGRLAADGTTVTTVVSSLPCAGDTSFYNRYAATLHCAATDSVLPEITRVRGVITSNTGRELDSPWTTVSDPYPDAAVKVAVPQWTADPGTGKVSFDVTVSGATLAKGGALCENAYCYPVLQGGRLAADGTTVTTVVSSLPCAGDTSFYNRYAATLHCAATDSVLPEITRVRGVITSNTGRELDSPWTTVSDPYPDAAVTLNPVTWTADTATGNVSYDVTVSGTTLAKGGGICENSTCNAVLQGGRLAADGTTVTTVVSSLPCAGDTSFYNRYAATLHCAATDSVLPEITRVRGVITSNTGRELDSPWKVVSAAYPDPSVSLPSATWTPNTSTGQVTYDVTVQGVSLAKSGGTCENTFCYPVLQAGRLNADGTVNQLTTLPCTGDTSFYNRYTATLHCAATDSVLPEITRVRGIITNSSGASVASDWMQVSNAYPASTLSATAATWTPDKDTGKVSYDVTVSGATLARAGGVCENAYCYPVLQAGRLAADGSVDTVVSSLPCTGDTSFYNRYTATLRCTATDSTVPETTRIRAVITSNTGHELDGPWTVVSAPYPDPRLTLPSVTWTPNTSTGQVSYDVAVAGATLAKGGAICENAYCYPTLQAGRTGPDGSVTVVTTLPCTGDTSFYNRYTATLDCAATGSVLPETTQIRAVVTSNTGRELDGAWTPVSAPYPDPALTSTVSTWNADPTTGQVSYDVAVAGATLAKGGAICENAYCYPTLQAGRTGPDGSVTVVTTLPCTGDTSFYNRYTATLDCAATGSVLPETTQIRAVVTSNTGRELDGAWTPVSAPYPDPTVDLNVDQWDFTGDTASNAAYFNINVHSHAAGLARAQGPCENRYCSVAFEGGTVDANGLVRTTSTLSADGDTSIYNRYTADISDHYGHALIPDQQYLRTAIYSNGYLVLATAWRPQSSVGLTSTQVGAGGNVAAGDATAAAAVGLLAARAPALQDPCVEAFPEGSHDLGSSLNDEQYGCEGLRAGRGLGTPGTPDGPPIPAQSWLRTFAALAQRYGPAVITSASAAVATDLGIRSDTTPTVSQQDDPDYLNSVGKLLRREHVTTYGYNAIVDLQAVARQVTTRCRAIAVSTQCDNMPIFSPGSDVYDAAVTDAQAIGSGYPFILTASSRATTEARGLPSRWYDLPGTSNACSSRDRGQFDCDEYPFYSTAEASTQSYIRPANPAQNQREGQLLNGFYNVCGMRPPDPGRQFIVVPIPTTDGPPTSAWC